MRVYPKETIKVPAIWHNCNNCRIHYMSEQPHVRAHLCDECWFSIPHMRLKNKPKKRIKKPVNDDYTIIGAILYILGCTICILIIGYYLWVK